MRGLLSALALCAAACGGGNDQLGLDAWLRIPGAQYVAGPLPTPSGGPEVIQAFASRNDIAPGLRDRSLHGSLALSATGAVVGLAGDRGYWVLPAGPPDAQTAGALSVDAALVFSPLLPTGSFDLIVRAVSADGRVGSGATIQLQAQEPSVGVGGLAITLSWDAEADLDLHVVGPSGTEIYWARTNSDGGRLDFDSNQSCIIDGRRSERVSWPAAAPSGHYLVRVDTPSLCGTPTAHWRVRAETATSVIGEVQGQSISYDTRGPHAAGAGLLVLELDLP